MLMQFFARFAAGEFHARGAEEGRKELVTCEAI